MSTIGIEDRVITQCSEHSKRTNMPKINKYKVPSILALIDGTLESFLFFLSSSILFSTLYIIYHAVVLSSS